jgi:hypothetical protein
VAFFNKQIFNEKFHFNLPIKNQEGRKEHFLKNKQNNVESIFFIGGDCYRIFQPKPKLYLMALGIYSGQPTNTGCFALLNIVCVSLCSKQWFIHLIPDHKQKRPDKRDVFLLG